jgi:hypothetical protein
MPSFLPGIADRDAWPKTLAFFAKLLTRAIVAAS